MNKTLLATAVLLALASTAHSAENGRYLYGEGEAFVVNEQKEGIDRVLGGSTTTADYKTGSVAVNTGKWNMIAGGSYLTDTTGELTIGFESTTVTINSTEDDVVTARHVIGGTAGSNPQKVVSPNNTSRTAKLTINGGSYGNLDDWKTANTLESLIVGGDHFKNNASDDAGKHLDNSADVYLKSTETQIRDATVDSLIIGGSLANQYYAKIGSGVLSTHVGTANTTIVNSTLNMPVVAGGVACGINAVSHVNQANLAIHDSTVNNTVYTGGLLKYGDTSSGKVSADVGNSTIFITNSKIKEIENKRGFAKWTDNDGWIFKTEEGEALNDEGHDAVTDLTLVNSDVETVNLSKGNITLGVEKNGVTSITNITLGDEVVKRLATADGVTNDALGGDVKALLENHIKIGDGSTAELLKNAAVEMAEGEAVGKVTGQIVGGKLDENSVVEHVNQKSLDVTNLLSMMPRFVTRVEMNDLRKRMGDLRTMQGQSGVWARYDGGKLSGQGLDHKFNKIQVGADTMPTDNGIRYGVALSYTLGDVDGSAATADTDTYSLAGYAVWLGEQGQFADVIARVAKVGTDLDTAAYSADLDQLALSLSGEFGWRFDLAKSLYIEPSIEATYTYIEDESFTGTSAHFEIDSTDSFMTRAGAALGWKLPDDRGDIYVRGGVVHEFLGDSELSVNHGFRTVELDGQDTWFEYAIGGTYKVGNNAYVYLDIERSAGGDIDVDWRANIGARYAF